jgi:hypothetical protein
MEGRKEYERACAVPFLSAFPLAPFRFRPVFGRRFRFVSVSFLCLLGLLFRFCFRFRSAGSKNGKEATQAATRNETAPRGKAEAIWGDTGRGGRGGGQCPFRTLRALGGLLSPFPTSYIHTATGEWCAFLLFLAVVLSFVKGREGDFCAFERGMGSVP